ncbi:RNA polymerase sigma factor [Lacticaseibacillus manihotivorans]|uniref:RNA polymerase sigma factor n=1 Tax=Lacticaseibacillus manihotivorans TaxID=88233 RepID=UPI0006CF67C7|nr:hypothetical protein [Lacticaseibacillus manihotivorans]
MNYVRQSLKNERINRHKVKSHRIKETLLEDWLIEEIEDPQPLEEPNLTPKEVSKLENFIENERLAMSVATLSMPDKIVLYQYYYNELTDAEIGGRCNRTSQGVNYRRQRALNRLRTVYKNL